LDVSTRHSLLFFNRDVNKKVMRNFIYIQHIVKITVVLGHVLFWKGISGLKFPCFLFYAC